MRRYETIVIIDPDVSEDQRNALLDRIKESIDQQSGLLVDVDVWGSRRLAYEIKKKERGYYICLNYCGTGDLVNELERLFRIDDRVLKYMTVLLAKDINLDQIKEDMAKAKEEQSQEESRPAAETEPEQTTETPNPTAEETEAVAETATSESAEDEGKEEDK